MDKEEQKKFDFKIVYEYAGFNKMNTGINIDSYEAFPDSITAYCDRKQCMITDNKGNPVNSITIKRKMTVNSKRIAQLIALDKKKAAEAEKAKWAAIKKEREKHCNSYLKLAQELYKKNDLMKTRCYNSGSRRSSECASWEISQKAEHFVDGRPQSLRSISDVMEYIDNSYDCVGLLRKRGIIK